MDKPLQGSQLWALGLRHESSHPLHEPELPGGWQGRTHWRVLQQLPWKRHQDSAWSRIPGISPQGKGGAFPLCLCGGSHSDWMREAVCITFMMEWKQVFSYSRRDKVSSSGDWQAWNLIPSLSQPWEQSPLHWSEQQDLLHTWCWRGTPAQQNPPAHTAPVSCGALRWC